jgi:hypothetical protein
LIKYLLICYFLFFLNIYDKFQVFGKCENKEIKKFYATSFETLYILNKKMNGIDVFSLRNFEIINRLKMMHEN